MKYTKNHEAARSTFHQIVLSYYRGRITYMEMNKAIFKAVAQHHYSDAWTLMATIAMNASSVLDFERRVANQFTEIVYA